MENTVIDKLNKEFMWHCKTIDDVKFAMDSNSFAQIKRINEIIDNLNPNTCIIDNSKSNSKQNITLIIDKIESFILEKIIPVQGN